MEAIFKTLKAYLQKTLDLHFDTLTRYSDKGFPLFLRERYVFYQVLVENKPHILMISQGEDNTTPAVICKHYEQVQIATQMPCIYVAAHTPAYNRQRLMKHRVQFVIPGRQVYLPALGIDWLDSCKICRTNVYTQTVHSPAAQTVIIYALLHPDEYHFLPSKLAKLLKYTPMTMTRALDELESAKLGETTRKGKERQFDFVERKSLWERGKGLMKSPIKKQLWLQLLPGGIDQIKKIGTLAGLSSLSHFSMLSGPTIPVFAISSNGWKNLQKSRNIKELPNVEEADIQLEVWSYDPKLFEKQGHADPFSIYLSLSENTDERIQQALEEMLENRVVW